MIIIHLPWLALLYLLLESFRSSSCTDQSSLDVIPQVLPDHWTPSTQYRKYIPRLIWIAVKDREDPLPGPLQEFFERNRRWNRTICDNRCKDEFMDTVFANTSLHWAYSKIHMAYAASKADIWRYAVLYTYGGMYIDDDSDMKTPLDEVVSGTDRLIMSEEGASSMGDCYAPTYHLSDTHTYFTYPNYSNAAHYTGMSTDTSDAQIPLFFHGNTLVNWAIFAAPRHPVFLRTMRNIVEIVRSVYQRRSIIHLTRWDVKFKTLFCTTNFVLTYSVRELELQGCLSKEEVPRILEHNFRQYKGNVKAISTMKDPSHYRNALKKHAPHYLNEMVPLSLEELLDHLDGKAVMGDSGRAVYLIHKGHKRSFPDYATFLKMKFTDKHTKHVGDDMLDMIPDGAVIRADEDIVSAYSTAHVHKLLTQASAHHGKQRVHEVRVEERVDSKELDAESHSGPSAGSRAELLPQTDAAPSTGRSAKKSIFLSRLSNDSVYMTGFLRNVTSVLNDQRIDCWGDDYGGTRDDFLQGRWKDVIGSAPLMVYPLCVNMFQLGNTLGYYLNDLACADLAGAHFIAVGKQFKITQPDILVTEGPDQYEFFHHLPDLVIHPHPQQTGKVKAEMKAVCQCLQFCWENSEAPWLRRIPLIRTALQPAVDAYVRISNGTVAGTKVDPETDKSSMPSTSFHPLIPNVTIQYRCGDNIGFGKTKYGLLPFSAYNHRRIPVSVARYIYIIADSPNRSRAHVYSNRCEIILQRLFSYLRKQFPQAVVLLKRGGDVFLDYARIMYSDVVVCSASTFCLWPALANLKGQVHFPLTPLIARAESISTAPDLGSHFHWISEVQMIKEFKHYRPWNRVIDDLEAL